MKDDISKSELLYGSAIVFCSACAFSLVNKCVHAFGLIPNTARNAWKWRNTCVSLIHSTLTGIWAVLCFVEEPKMAEDLISTYTTFSQTLVGVSVGYFVYDTLDMVINNLSRHTYELVIHHAVILCCFGISLVYQSYIGYAVVALIIEINSIFLHIRQLLQMMGFTKDSSIYRFNSVINLGTFVGCRIATLAWMTRWIIVNRDLIPLVMYSIGNIGLAIMMVINIILLFRLLQSDFSKKKESQGVKLE